MFSPSWPSCPSARSTLWLVLTPTMYSCVMPKRASMDERWREKVDVGEPDACWLWKASLDADGYGRFQEPTPDGQRHIRAHRWTYEHFVGPVPIELVVMHVCDVRACVNPAHLRLGTSLENNDDKVGKGRQAKLWGTPLNRARQSHCKRGHPLSGANLWTNPKTGHRRCKRCAADHVMAYYWRSKGVM